MGIFNVKQQLNIVIESFYNLIFAPTEPFETVGVWYFKLISEGKLLHEADPEFVKLIYVSLYLKLFQIQESVFDGYTSTSEHMFVTPDNELDNFNDRLRLTY